MSESRLLPSVQSFWTVVGSDFGQVVEPDILFTPENAQQTLCRPIPLTDDAQAEDPELFVVRLSTSNDNVILGPLVHVTVFDNDSELAHTFTASCSEGIFLTAAVVGLEMSSYTVEEGSGTVQVCVVSSPELDKSVEIELKTVEGSAGNVKSSMRIIQSCLCFHPKVVQISLL